MEVTVKDKKITVELEISDAFCESVMTTAIESGQMGIDYFATVMSVKREHVDDADSPLNWRYVSFVVREDDSQEEGKERVESVVTYDDIRKGIALVIKTSAHKRKAYVEAIATDDPGQLDSNDADIITQMVMFGEVVYG